MNCGLPLCWSSEGNKQRCENEWSEFRALLSGTETKGGLSPHLWQREATWQSAAQERGWFYWGGFKPTPSSQKSSVIKAEQCPGQLKCSFLYDCTSMLIFLQVNILQGALRKWAQSWCRALAGVKRSSGNCCSSRAATKRWTHPHLLQSVCSIVKSFSLYKNKKSLHQEPHRELL